MRKSFLIIIKICIFYIYYHNIAFSNIQNNNQTTTIKAKTIKIIRNSGKIELIDNAIIENADTSILSDKIIVFYDEQDNNGKASIKEAQAIGGVKIFNEEFVATGHSGFYNHKDESFIINDNVIFNDGTSIARGEKFIYNLATKKGLLMGNKNEVNDVKNNRVMVIINEAQ